MTTLIIPVDKESHKASSSTIMAIVRDKIPVEFPDYCVFSFGNKTLNKNFGNFGYRIQNQLTWEISSRPFYCSAMDALNMIEENAP